jgi:cytochrome c peroxidase
LRYLGSTAARALLAIVPAMAACGGQSPAAPAAGSSLRDRALAAGLAPMPATPPYPTANGYNADRVELGHLLFFDPLLSGPRDLACSTCHLPRFAFTDGRQFPSGAGGSGLGPERTTPTPPPLRPMPRNSPPTLNIGLFGHMSPDPSVNGTMFWGGNAFGLEQQVLNPMTADKEMRGLAYSKGVALDSVLARLRAVPDYVARFARAFPDVVASEGNSAVAVITTTTLRRALAAYLRELVTPRAPIDAYLQGDDSALDSQQQAGLELFIGKAGCVQCHRGPLLSDFAMHVLGTPQAGIGRDTTPGDDLGWGEVGGTPYAFRTPQLRQVTLTAPYFHAGTAATLEDVIGFKNAGRSGYDRVAQSQLDGAVRPLGLSDQEIQELVAFLGALTDTTTVKGPLFQAPAAVPSGLTVPR